jgi:hypothetical protein
MSSNPLHDISTGETVMWEEDYERLKKQQKMDAAIERSNKEKADAIARELYKEQLKIKDKIEYTEELATEICERISAGELLINICRDSHMPTVRRCSAWLKSEVDFQALYNMAIADRLTIFEEEVISIADDAARDMKEIQKSGKTIRVQDAEVIARAKLRVEVRFRHLKAGRPGKWGDSTTLITKSEDENIAEMPLSELEKKIAELEHKDRVVKAV